MGAGAGVPLRELGLVLLVALSLAYLTTGVIRYLMVRSNWMTEIRDRDVHTIPKPRMGGVAMFTGFIGAVFLADQLPALTRGFQPITPEMNAVVGGAVIIVMLGAIDDLWELDALTKIIGQLLGALIMSMLGLNWTLLYIPFGDGTTVLLDQFWSVVITVLFTVTLINAINFVDGLDGLAAGLGMIAGGSILLFSLTILHDQGGMVSASSRQDWWACVPASYYIILSRPGFSWVTPAPCSSGFCWLRHQHRRAAKSTWGCMGRWTWWRYYRPSLWCSRRWRYRCWTW